MKALVTALILATALCGCRLYTVTQGEGYVYTDNGNFLCVNNSGDCVQQYDSPTTETLQALPSPDYAFTRWEGCHYDSLTSCEAEISQRAVDEDMEWTITAVFEKKRPDVEPAQYTYNALGQRITKTVGGVTTVFQYDLEGKLIAELDATGHPLRQHAYLEGAPIAMIERKTPDSEPEVYYVHTDHLATPDLITNDQGRIVADFEKSPFGVPYVNYSEIDYHLGFPGQYYDEESGLHYNYHRYYDANTGRYMQSDPVGLRGGINTFVYVLQNPVTYHDPFGLEIPTATACGLFFAGFNAGDWLQSAPRKEFLESHKLLENQLNELNTEIAQCKDLNRQAQLEKIKQEHIAGMLEIIESEYRDKSGITPKGIGSLATQGAICAGLLLVPGF